MGLRYRLRYPYPLKQDVANAPPMHEGYALFLKEERHYTRLICISVYFITVVLHAVNTGDLKVSVYDVMFWNFSLWSTHHVVLLNYRSWSDLLSIYASSQIIWWLFFRNKNLRLDCEGIIYVLVIFITGMLYPTFLQLFVEHSIRIDWKEIRSLLW